jgi:NADPH:quinone reductase-like Zn-dependent oxidoreductase
MTRNAQPLGSGAGDRAVMQAIVAERRGPTPDLRLESVPIPARGTGDVLVAVHAAGYTPGELAWPSTWVDRSGHDRAPAIPCHEFSGTISALGFGVAGLELGAEVFGLVDWYRDGAAAAYVAVAARDLAAKPASIDHVAAATLPLAGLIAWQALHEHGRVQAEDSVLVLGAAGGVGALAVQLAHQAGARVIAAARAGDRTRVMTLGADTFLDAERAGLDAGEPVSLIVDTVGGSSLTAAYDLAGPGTRLVSIVDPTVSAVLGDRGVFFVVEADRETLRELAGRVDAGDLRPVLGRETPLSGASDLIGAKERGEVHGKIALSVSDGPPQ